MSNRYHIHIPITVLTGVLVIGMALLAGGFLWALHRIHGQMAHETAALSVLERGRIVAEQLAREDTVKRGLGSEQEWNDFASTVRRLAYIERALQYVSVVDDGITLFHEQIADGKSKTVSDVVGGASDVVVGRKLLQSGDKNIPVLVFTAGVRTQDGKERTVEVALRREAIGEEESAAVTVLGSMFRLSFATVLAAFGICTALIIWMMGREARREERRREEESLAFAGMLANGIAHDFRNPMSSLKLDAQMISREIRKGAGADKTRLAELAGHICSTADRMEKVVQEFLLLSRPVGEDPVRVNVGGVIEEVLELLSPRFQARNVKVEMKGVECPIFAKVPVTAFRRALLNVITNAEQFSKPDGTVLIKVSSFDGMAVVAIEDNGPGISDRVRDTLFEMFVTTRPGGTGLGLYLARTAIERCGGSIKATNKPEGGASFTLFVPLDDSNEGGIKS